MVMSLRERRRQMLRDEVLQAARVLLAEKGYAAMSMEELATRVGISKPTLYSHFATKEDLIVAAVAQSMQYLIDIIETELVDQTPLQSLKILLRTAIQILIDQDVVASRPMTPELIQLIRSRDETIRYIQRIDHTIIDLVQQGIVQGEIDPDLDPNAIVLAFHGMIHTLKIGFFGENHITNLDSIANSMVTMFERSVRPVSTAPPAAPGAAPS